MGRRRKKDLFSQMAGKVLFHSAAATVKLATASVAVAIGAAAEAAQAVGVPGSKTVKAVAKKAVRKRASSLGRHVGNAATTPVTSLFKKR